MIIGFSGKKQSGKDSQTNFIVGNFLDVHELIKNFNITEDGKLFVETWDENMGVFDLDDQNPKMQQFLNTEVYPFVRPFSFASPLKQLVIDFLGLDPSSCYGSNEDKEKPTQYTWKQIGKLFNDPDLIKKSGHPSSRDLQKYIGNRVRHTLNENHWLDRAIEGIIKYKSELSIVRDVRFPNEVKAIQKAGGVVIRLTRDIYPDDQDESETALNPENFDWSQFDYVFDNSNLDLADSLTELYKILQKNQWIPKW